MTRQRFYMIRVNLDVVDNLSVSEEEQKKNRLWIIQPVIDLVRNRCKAIERKEKIAFSIDEQMIPFLGRCPVRQFVKIKPRPVGLKNFVLTTSDGLVLDFEIYQGITTPLKDRDLGLGPSIILHLAETLPQNSYLYFDRYFSTIALMNKLTSFNIDATATIMSNRVKGFDFKKDSLMIRGESEEVVRTDNKVCITKWKDNKFVLMISTAFGRQPETEVHKWNKTEKKTFRHSMPSCC
ncbi:piggyBac transposable element-derived protein 3-like [Anthonomus grandis grandis]|uniref:piggyBac transposable element-derived protein 3-like n=1 Tax=Anthonomus grandis grandis TaxID=2921223 RepID=UPI0021658A3C|nr:piggyBac transposable element-derived protein 3-like [Anthonomus grandis grandis]